MKDEIQDLREAFFSLSNNATPSQNCPSPERVWAAVHLELNARERRDVIDHTSSCATCAETWRLAHAVSPVIVDAAPAPRGFFKLAWMSSYSLAGAAAVLTLAVLGRSLIVGPMMTRGPAAEYRDPTQVSVRSLLPEGAVTRQQCWLRWTSGPEGSRYDVRVMSEDLAVLVDVVSLESPEFQVPEGKLTGVPPNGNLLWQVEIRLPDGGRLRSPTFMTRVQ